MTRRISVINYKGGTGKTTTVVNLGHALAIKKKRVLIVDTDSQGSAGFHLGIQSERTLYDLLVGNLPPEDCIIKARPNLDLICANERLFPAEIQLTKLKDKELVLSQHLAKLSNYYDYILLDCAPSLNLLNQNVLLFAEEILLPVSMEYMALFGIKQLLNNITLINKLYQHRVRISKVIPTFFDKRYRKSKDVLSSLQRAFPEKVTEPIRMCIAISEAAGFNKTIFEYDPDSNGVKDYNNLADEVLKNG